MSISLRNSLWPQEAHAVRLGRSAAASWAYQASAPSFRKRSTMLLLTALSLRGSPHLSQRKTAMGTPQMRWREMHQSGRGASMLGVRSWPQPGCHTSCLSSSRRVGGAGGGGGVGGGVWEGGVVGCGGGEEGEDVGLGGGVGVILSAYQIAVDDDGGEESFGDDVGSVGAVQGDVFEVWVEGYGLGGWEGPGGGGPDGGVDGLRYGIWGDYPHVSAQMRARRWGTLY